MWSRIALLSSILLWTASSYAQSHQSIENGSFNIQMMGDGNMIFQLPYDTTFHALKQFVSATSAVYDKRRKEDFSRLRNDISMFLQLQGQLYDSLTRAQGNMENSLDEIKLTQLRLRAQIRKVEELDERNFLSILQEVGSVNQNINETRRMILDKLNHICDDVAIIAYDKKMKIEQRNKKDLRKLIRAEDFRAGKLSLYKLLFLRSGLSIMELKSGDFGISSDPGLTLQTGAVFTPYRYKKSLNINIMPVLVYGTSYTSVNGARYASQTFMHFELQLGGTFHTNLRKRKWSSDLVIPLNAVGSFNLYHKYKNHLTNYNSILFNEKNEYTGLARIHPLMTGLSTGVLLQFLRSGRGGFIIGPVYTQYFTDYYRKDYVDYTGNYPYAALSSRLSYITIMIGYIFN